MTESAVQDRQIKCPKCKKCIPEVACHEEPEVKKDSSLKR